MIQANKDYAIGQSTGSYKHNRLCASLKCISTLVIMMLCTLTTWGQTYTVTLKAGDGTGDDITISNADAANVATDFKSAAGGQFWQEGEAWWFKLPECPNSFKAPSGKVFKDWIYAVFNETQYALRPMGIILLSNDLTVTAQWKEPSNASLMLSLPDVISINYGTEQTDFEMEITSATFNPEANYKAIGLFLYSSSFSCATDGGTIPFTLTGKGVNIGNVSGNKGISILIMDSTTLPNTWQITIHISSSDLETASPGTYYASLNWEYRENSSNILDAGTITLTLTVPDSTPPEESYDLTANEATLNGVSKYWTTFYHPSLSYELQAGAQAFYLNKTDYALYRLGDGNIIPAGTPVIIMADAATISLTTLDSTTLTNPEDNKLNGTAVATATSSLTTGGKKVYVMSKVNETLGFYEFSGTTIPANKAYYY